LTALVEEYLSAYSKDEVSDSLTNTVHHSYLVRELRLIYDRYCSLEPDRDELARFIEERQKRATQMMQASVQFETSFRA
jgi:hypothetical protein